ncbi:ketoreductase domain-containing protein [Micromonospora sp. M12]
MSPRRCGPACPRRRSGTAACSHPRCGGTRWSRRRRGGRAGCRHGPDHRRDRWPGALLARHLAEAGVKHLLLLSRRGPAADGADLLRDDLEALGAEVSIVACDAADRDQLASVLDTVPAEYPLTGVVHAAGVLSDAVVTAIDAGQLETVLRPKVDAGWNLHELTAGAKLDAFVVFSSVAGVLGGPGQGVRRGERVPRRTDAAAPRLRAARYLAGLGPVGRGHRHDRTPDRRRPAAHRQRRDRRVARGDRSRALRRGAHPRPKRSELAVRRGAAAAGAGSGHPADHRSGTAAAPADHAAATPDRRRRPGRRGRPDRPRRRGVPDPGPLRRVLGLVADRLDTGHRWSARASTRRWRCRPAA